MKGRNGWRKGIGEWMEESEREKWMEERDRGNGWWKALEERGGDRHGGKRRRKEEEERGGGMGSRKAGRINRGMEGGMDRGCGEIEWEE